MYITIKIVGAILILFGGLLCGKKVKSQYKKRREILKIMQEALNCADDMITIENVLLDDVLINCGEKYFYNDNKKDVWTIASQKLKTEYGSFENAWAKACDEYFDEMVCLNDKDKECIISIGKAIGIANTQRQSAYVASTIEKLKELEKEAIACEEKEGKNAIKIAMAVSVSVIVLLF